MLLRNSDIFTTTIRGVTTKTDNFTATAGQTQFTLTQTAVKNIRSLTVNSVPKYFINNYIINWTTGVVTLSVGANLNDPVAIQYDYGSGDKIYPDYPRSDLTLTSFPRIGMEIISSTTSPLGLGGTTHISDLVVQIFLWMPINKDVNIAGGLGGTKDLNDYMSDIRSIIRTNAKNLYSFRYITPIGTSPVIIGTNQKIIQISQDFSIKFLVE
jgi:hypothetical protein